MIKQFILLFNLFSIAMYQVILGGGGVTATQNFPDNIQPGQTFEITITINKGTVSSFAKFSQTLPAGFTAVNENAAGGSFSFTNGKVNIIWMAIPTTPSFQIKYKVTASQTAGSYDLAGKFSYIQDNARQSAQVTTKTLKVGNGAPSNNEEANQPNNTNQGQSNETAATSPSNNATESTTNEPTTVTTTTTTEPTTPSAVSISGERSITKLGDRSYSVTVKINKSGINGFAKLEEKIPAGFKAAEIQSASGVFSFENNIVKILWMQMPSTDIVVSYKLAVVDDNLYGKQVIAGAFSYLQGDQAKKYLIEPSTIDLGSAPTNVQPVAVVQTTPSSSDSTMATTSTPSSENSNSGNQDVQEVTTVPSSNPQNNTQPTAVVQTTTTESPASTDTTAQAVAVTTTSPSSSTENVESLNNTGNVNSSTSATPSSDNSVSNVPAPESDITYKVQIAAGHHHIPSNYFKKKFGITSTVNREQDNGWIKYTVGDYKTYQDAHNKRNSIWNGKGISDAFITAYKDGQRITVQEALMISHQQWYK